MNLKTFKNCLTLLFIIIYCAHASAQDNPTYPIGPDGKHNLSGLWIASCPFEYAEHSSANRCPICNRITDPEDMNNTVVLPLKIFFEDDSLRLNNTGKWFATSYSMNKITHTIRFYFRDTEYKFRVFYWGDNIILENSDGLPVVLKRED